MGFLDNEQLQRFFSAMDAQFVALAYDDVLDIPQQSDVHPSRTSVASLFSRNVPVKIPIISAAMDTVTEAEMAITLAKLGGLGVIHKNNTPEKQAEEVARVKYHVNGIVRNPRSVVETESVENLVRRHESKKRNYSNYPVISAEGRLLGIININDIEKFCEDPALPVTSMMRQAVTAPDGTDLYQARNIMREAWVSTLLLIADDRKLTGLYTITDVKNRLQGDKTPYNLDDNGQLRVAAAIGTGKDALHRLELLAAKGVDAVVIDTAHAHTEDMARILREIKSMPQYHHIDVVAGNISRPEAARFLIEHGADGVKVGMGPGSICTTRIVTGSGYPQLSAVYDCARVAHEAGVPLCADGGLRYSGDIPKALIAGASTVMMGSMLAGAEEAPGEMFELNGKKLKTIRGMGSLSAMLEGKGASERYRQEGNQPQKLTPEGVEGAVPYTGPLKDMIAQYIGGLQGGMGYVGAASIADLHAKGTFVRVTEAGRKESAPHDLAVIREAPNYRV